MTRFDALSQTIEREGWATNDAVLASDVVSAIANELTAAQAKSAGRGGVRNLLASQSTVRRLAAEGPLRDAAVAVLGPAAGAVRAILFDKTPDANWKVVWHQDLTIAVQEEHAVPGYGPWSLKEGVVHVQPPVGVLEQMLAVRLHLDDCTSENGPVRVLPGSHREGRLSPHDIETWRTAVREVICTVPRGGLLLFRPLLLHASSAAHRATHRRVLHIEYGPPDLAPPIRWHTWVGAAVSKAA
jgi:hypothetical protein